MGLAAMSCALTASVAVAATPIAIAVSPRTVAHGQTLKISGSGWAVIEFCKPRVTLTLERSAPVQPLGIATVALRTGATDTGTFSTTWTVPASVRGGLRTIVATQRCESGKNGSIHLVTRSTTVRVK